MTQPGRTKRRQVYCCYLLQSINPNHPNSHYIGFTTNVSRRIRQHNGELDNGARKTRRKRPWEVIVFVYGFPSKISALQFEWAWQNPKRSRIVKSSLRLKRYKTGAKGKTQILHEMLGMKGWGHLPLKTNWVSEKHRQKFRHNDPPSNILEYTRPLQALAFFATRRLPDRFYKNADKRELLQQPADFLKELPHIGSCGICKKTGGPVSSKCDGCRGFYHVICLAKAVASEISALIPSKINCPHCSAPTPWYTVLRNVLKSASTLEVGEDVAESESDHNLSETESKRLFKYAKKLMVESSSESESKSESTDSSDDDEVIFLQRRKLSNSQRSPSRKFKDRKSAPPSASTADAIHGDLSVPKLQSIINESLIIPPDPVNAQQYTPDYKRKKDSDTDSFSRTMPIFDRPTTEEKEIFTNKNCASRSVNPEKSKKVILNTTAPEKRKVINDVLVTGNKLERLGEITPNLSPIPADNGDKFDKSAGGHDLYNESFHDSLNSSILDLKTDPAQSAVLGYTEAESGLKMRKVKDGFYGASDDKVQDSNQRVSKSFPINSTSRQGYSEVINENNCLQIDNRKSYRIKIEKPMLRTPELINIHINGDEENNSCKIRDATPKSALAKALDSQPQKRQKSCNKLVTEEATEQEQQLNYRTQASLLLDTTVEDVQNEIDFNSSVEKSALKPLPENVKRLSTAVVHDETRRETLINKTPCQVGYVAPNACDAPFSESPKWGLKGYRSPGNCFEAFSQSPGCFILNRRKVAQKRFPKWEDIKKDDKSSDTDPGRSDPALMILSPLNDKQAAEINTPKCTPSPYLYKKDAIRANKRLSTFHSPGDSLCIPIVIDGYVSHDAETVRDFSITAKKGNPVKVSKPNGDCFFTSPPLRTHCSQQKTPSSSSAENYKKKKRKRKRKRSRNIEVQSAGQGSYGTGVSPDVTSRKEQHKLSLHKLVKRAKLVDERKAVTPDTKNRLESPPSGQFLRLQTPPQHEGPPRLSLNMFRQVESDSDGQPKPPLEMQLIEKKSATTESIPNLKPSPKRDPPPVKPMPTIPTDLPVRKHNSTCKKDKKKKDANIMSRDMKTNSPASRDSDSSSGSEVPFAERLRRRLQR